MRNAWSCHDGRADRVHYVQICRTYLAECYTRTMIRVDIGGNLKDESGEFRFVRFHFTLFCLYRTRTGSNLHKAVQQFLYTKIIQGRAKEYRRAISCQIRFHIQFRINSFDQFQIATQFVCQRLTDLLIQFFRMYVDFYLLRHHLFGRLVQVQFLLINIIYSFEAGSLFDRP